MTTSRRRGLRTLSRWVSRNACLCYLMGITSWRLNIHISQEICVFHLFSLPSATQAAGKYRQLGRNYVVEDGDIIFFKFNTPNAPKKK